MMKYGFPFLVITLFVVMFGQSMVGFTADKIEKAAANVGASIAVK